MYVYNVDKETIDKFLRENSRVLVGVYEENCPISSLFLGMLRQLRKNLKREEIVLIINKVEYMKYFKLSKVNICPKIVVFENGEMVKTIEGFKNYQAIYEKIVA